MNRLALAALAMAFGAVVPASSVAGQQRYEMSRSEQKREQERIRRADPAKVIATELAFARTAQEKGQWTAFIEFAADDAVMFVPQAVNAKEWLKKQKNPSQAVRWQPHQVWSSCDGTFAVTRGAWQRPNGTVGYFTTIWRRKKDGSYEWVLDQGDGLEQALAAPEMIASKVADCPSPQAEALDAFDAGHADWEANVDAGGAVAGVGESRDYTLFYRYLVTPSGARETSVFLLLGGKMEQVMHSQVAAE